MEGFQHINLIASVKLLLIFIIIPLQAENDDYISHERNLFKNLTDNYEREIRPVQNVNDPVNVKFEMSILSIDLNEEDQELQTNAWLRYAWPDVQLKWKPEEYGGINTMNIDVDKLWTPDVVLYNTHKSAFDVAYRALAVVSSDGSVLWVPPIYISSSCQIDFTHFPFDTQTCSLRYGSWTYAESKVNLTFYSDSRADISLFLDHHTFDLISAEAKRNAIKYSCCPELYVDIEYTIILKRKPTYATHMFLAPSVVLCLILPAIFVLPPESSEKIQFGIGLLLSNALVLTMIASLIPSAHPTMPAIGLYHMTNMILIGVSMLISTFVMNIWSKGNRGKKLPGFIQQIVLNIFGKILCVPRQDFMPVNSNISNQFPPTTMRTLEIMTDDPDSTTPREDADNQDIFKSFAYNAQRAEWHQLAVIIDRVCLIVYMVLVIVTSLSLATR